MPLRPIVEIDRELCDGCGLCINACAEASLALDSENKAYLIKEIYCDGLGACLDVCPQNALKVTMKESKAYDEKATYKHVKKTKGEVLVKNFNQDKEANSCKGNIARAINHKTNSSNNSELSQWPIQLQLVVPEASYFEASDLLIAADCTAFSFGLFHSDILKGKKLVIACPKLDKKDNYVEKLSQIIANNTIYSITVVIMSVPCCSGLMNIVEKAINLSGKNIAIKKIIIDLDGQIL